MALKEFTTRQMIRVTGFWLNDGQPKIQENPDLIGSLPLLQRAHQGLLLPPKSTAGSEAEKAVQGVQQKQKSVDLSFDRTGRGLIHLLLAHAQFALTAEQEATFLRVLHELFPLHFDTMMQSYEEEAGSVELLEGKLSDEFRQVLKEIPVSKEQNALDKILAHIKAGRELGTLEQKKNTLKDSLSPSAKSPGLQAAKLHWVRTVHMFLSLLAIAKISKEDSDALREPVRKAEEVVARRKRGEVVEEEEPELIEEENTN
jgi:hypothetical protein